MAMMTTRTHGMLDYLTAGAMILLPRMLGASERATQLLTGAALGLIGSSALTRYEYSLWPVVPMEGHLVLDGVSGASLAAAPFFMPEEDSTGKMMLVGFGLFELVAALTTETTPSYYEPAREMDDESRGAMWDRVSEGASQTVRR